MGTIIRCATVDDIPALIRLGRSFISQSQYVTLVIPDEAAMATTLRALIEGHIIFVVEVINESVLVGMLGMMTYAHVISNMPYAVELFWWVEPDYRGVGVTMLRDAEKWARKRGARFIQMVQPDNEPRLGDVYARMGYTPTERQFQKYLG